MESLVNMLVRRLQSALRSQKFVLPAAFLAAMLAGVAISSTTAQATTPGVACDANCKAARCGSCSTGWRTSSTSVACTAQITCPQCYCAGKIVR